MPEERREPDAETLRTLERILIRLNSLESRVMSLERKLSTGADEPVTASPPTQPAPANSPTKTDREQRTAPAVAEPRTPPPREPARSRGTTPAGLTSPGSEHRPDRDAPPPPRFEQLIGGRLFAMVGAIIVIAGLSFAARLAWKSGWVTLTDAGKCWALALAGAALIGVGEVLRRKAGQRSAAAFFAAGLGAMYVAVWATSGVYDLLPPAACFGLMAIVAAFGVGLAVYARLVLVAVLAVLGAYLAPMIARAPDPAPWALPVYLCMVTAVGLALSVLNTRYRILRTVCWWPVLLIGTLWMVTTLPDAPMTAVLFAVGVWALFHAELFVSTHRHRGEPTSALRSARPMISSFSTSAWSAAFAGVAFGFIHTGLDWLGPAGFCVACFLLAVVLVGHLRWLSEPPRTDEDRLGTSLLAQSGGLLLAAIGWGVSGWLQGLAALGVGAAAAVAARSLRSTGLLLYAFVALLFGTLRVYSLDLIAAHQPNVWSTSLAGLHLTGWSALALCTSACWLIAAAAAESLEGKLRSLLRPVIWAAAVATLATIPVHAETSPVSFAVWLSTIGLAVASLGGTLQRRLVEHLGDACIAAAVLVSLATGWFVTEDTRLAGFVLCHEQLSIVGVALALLVRSVMVALGHSAARASALPFYAVAAMAAFAAVPAHLEAQGSSLVYAWSAIAAAATAIHTRAARAQLDVSSVGAVTLAIGAWAVAFVGPGWVSSDATLGVHPGLVAALVISLVMALPLLIRSLRPGTPWTLNGWPAMLLAASVPLILLATSLEAMRVANVLFEDQAAQRGALSIWWGLFATGLLALGAWRTASLARYCGLALLGIATAKAVIWDLSSVNDAVRVASFVVLGLLLLGVSAAYLRVTRAGPRPGE